MSKTLLFLLTGLIMVSACDSIFNSNPKPKNLEFYQKEYKLPSNSSLKTDGFYVSPNNTENEGVYEYLKFYTDGLVVHFGGTSMTPKKISSNKFLDVDRKKDGTPKNKKENWGYFKSIGDSLKFTMVKHRGMSSPMYKFVGKIDADTLFFETFQLPFDQNGEIRKDGDCKYVFYAE